MQVDGIELPEDAHAASHFIKTQLYGNGNSEVKVPGPGGERIEVITHMPAPTLQMGSRHLAWCSL